MREILFRGKAVGSLKWVEGFYFREAGNFIKELPSAVSTETHMVYEDTVGQYTGLTDKNGKKIFEGDIIIESDGGMDGIPREVLWDEVWMQFETRLVRKHWAYGRNSGRLWLMRDRDIEIIGNIHDNPELLKGGAE